MFSIRVIFPMRPFPHHQYYGRKNPYWDRKSADHQGLTAARTLFAEENTDGEI
jgi:hypothetical protein